jgi:hypothetical protein
MIKLTLPFWNDQKNSASLITTAGAFWGELEYRCQLPLVQLHPQSSTPTMLNLIAWQRDITRLNTETLDEYRNRIANAFGCAADAGSTAGFKRIFFRLRIGRVDIFERVEGKDWDVIVLRLTDSQLAHHGELIKTAIEMYGRTCRRYEFDVVTSVAISLAAAEFSNTVAFDTAHQFSKNVYAVNRMFTAEFNHNASMDIAR